MISPRRKEKQHHYPRKRNHPRFLEFSTSQTRDIVLRMLGRAPPLWCAFITTILGERNEIEEEAQKETDMEETEEKEEEEEEENDDEKDEKEQKGRMAQRLVLLRTAAL